MEAPGIMKKATSIRKSMCLRTQGLPTSSPRDHRTSVEKMSNTRTHSEEDVSICYGSFGRYVGGKRQVMTGIMRKQPTDSLRARPDVTRLMMTKNAGESKSECSSGKRPRVTVREDVGKKSPTERTEDCVTAPSDNMETGIEKRGRNDRNAFPAADPTSVRSSENGTAKCEGCHANDWFIRYVTQMFEEEVERMEGLREEHDSILPEAQKVLGSVEGFDCESDHLVQNSREGKRTEIGECEANAATDRWKLQGEITRLKKANLAMSAEKAECEANAATDRRKLQGEISKLYQANIEMHAEKALMECERLDEMLGFLHEKDDLKKIYEGERENSRKKYEGLLAEKRDAELARDKVALNFEVSLEMHKKSIRLEFERKHSNQLAKEQEKSLCQICFVGPRDAVVLPCLHFHYCSRCLDTHGKERMECPACRGEIHGYLKLYV